MCRAGVLRFLPPPLPPTVYFLSKFLPCLPDLVPISSPLGEGSPLLLWVTPLLCPPRLQYNLQKSSMASLCACCSPTAPLNREQHQNKNHFTHLQVAELIQSYNKCMCMIWVVDEVLCFINVMDVPHKPTHVLSKHVCRSSFCVCFNPGSMASGQ